MKLHEDWLAFLIGVGICFLAVAKLIPSVPW